MYEKLSVFEDRYKELENQLMDMEVINNSELYQKVAIEHGELTPIVNKYREYREVKDHLEGAKSLFEEKLDDDMRELVKEEVKEGEE